MSFFCLYASLLHLQREEKKGLMISVTGILNFPRHGALDQSALLPARAPLHAGDSDMPTWSPTGQKRLTVGSFVTPVKAFRSLSLPPLGRSFC